MVAAIGSIIAAATTGCDTTEPAAPPSPPTVLGPDTPPPVSPPWTLAQLVNHPCTVLVPDDLARFGFADAGAVDLSGHDKYCRWITAAGNLRQVKVYFLPHYRQKFGPLEEINRTEKNFRTLTIADRPAFLIDDRSDSGHRNCKIWVSVASGGLFQFEYAVVDPHPDWDGCAAGIELATVMAEHLQ
ncbi:DUF3558 family protein [Nocardia sp. NPDC127606]|uniref:DUF3558 family protein n=1 Tax=Nocardia sp. NPDC127606 TaxID=3345406 RepID=UPI003644F017